MFQQIARHDSPPLVDIFGEYTPLIERVGCVHSIELSAPEGIRSKSIHCGQSIWIYRCTQKELSQPRTRSDGEIRFVGLMVEIRYRLRRDCVGVLAYLDDNESERHDDCDAANDLDPLF